MTTPFTDAEVAALRALLSVISVTPDTVTTPAMVEISCRNTSAGASQAIVNVPLPAVGTELILQINIAGQPAALLGGIDLRHTIMEDDSPATIAADFANQLNTGPDAALAQSMNITAQYTIGSGVVAVTNNAPDLVTLSDQSGISPSPFTIKPGSAAWDAGALHVLSRLTATLPLAGSNVGQYIFAGGSPEFPNQNVQQWATISCNVIDPELGKASVDVQLCDTKVMPLSVRPEGVYVLDDTGNLVNVGPLLMQIARKLGLR